MLKAEHLRYTVDDAGGPETIIRDVSFTVEDGEILVVTGPNGGGKSTIAKLLMGIIQPDGGSIVLNGQEISGLSIDQRSKAGMGFAFQQPPRFKGMTVRRLLNLAAGKELPEEVCCGLLSSVGLCAREYLNREADQTLSGGEMKRIEIATVFAKKHALSIFDEPEAGIDLWSFSMLVRQFEMMQRERDESLLIISHQERILRMADHILVIADGLVQNFGTRDEILPQILAEQTMPEGCACSRRGEEGFHHGA
ncbi:MAG: ABC transporter ATP-binding protein [Oscillospiraceae bacterium]|nr:MAG: ABC transporter ATP-binding protein [Oscillospiraceae bacterium]